MNSCDGCTLCCKLLEVKALNKPEGRDCEHCKDGGCAIYGQPERPQMCKAYQCAWLWNSNWPPSLRPDRCGVVFEPVGKDKPEVFIGTVDPERPTAWSEGAAAQAAERITREGFGIVLRSGKDIIVLAPKWKSRDAVLHEYKIAMRKLWRSPRTHTT